ncbi:MAG: cadmium-translocating P-type ATPase [Chlorobi bacterium]|nr:cadmium-translocating P-type ATPase [Chlorobiota bacterium]
MEYKTFKWFTYPAIRNALIAALIASVIFVLERVITLPPAVRITGYLAAMFTGGYFWIREGIEDLFKEGKIDIEILMLAATTGAAVLGMWDEAAFLVVLYALAEGFESYAYTRTRQSIRALLDLAPKEACVIRDDTEIVLPAESLKPGDIFLVRPGESVPTDGVVNEGESEVDEAPVTGESVPVYKKDGMLVFAGTINLNGALKIKVTKAFEDNTLSKMIHLVEEAQEQKGKAQTFISRFGRIYTPLVLVFSLLLFLFPLVFGGDMVFWANKAIILLVAAAPCALVMSMPVAVAAGIGKAGRNGILIKGGMHLENLKKIKAVALDKTGTLTTGKPVITDITGFNHTEKEVLEMAFQAEHLSEHPLAKAVVGKAEEQGIVTKEISGFNNIPGAGVIAQVGDQEIRCGKKVLFDEKAVSLKIMEQVRKLTSEGKTVIFTGTKDEIYGIIGLQDQIRDEARELVQNLHRMGVRVIMITGDNPETAQAIAGKLNIDDFRAGMKPEDKVAVVKELEKQYGNVAMVGDGINDIPALASATVGIAMGVAGTDAAIETADIALMGDRLDGIVYALVMGRQVGKISKQNIIFSILILAAMIPSALSGLLTIASAVVIHEVSELLAVGNGLRANMV